MIKKNKQYPNPLLSPLLPSPGRPWTDIFSQINFVGNTLAWASAVSISMLPCRFIGQKKLWYYPPWCCQGTEGYKNSRRGSSLAGQQAGTAAAKARPTFTIIVNKLICWYVVSTWSVKVGSMWSTWYMVSMWSVNQINLFTITHFHSKHTASFSDIMMRIICFLFILRKLLLLELKK